MRPLVNSAEGRRLAQKYSRQVLSALVVMNHRMINNLYCASVVETVMRTYLSYYL